MSDVFLVRILVVWLVYEAYNKLAILSKALLNSSVCGFLVDYFFKARQLTLDSPLDIYLVMISSTAAGCLYWA